MATPLTRVTQKQFGVSGPAGDFGIFGSKAAGSQTFSQDPVAIQSLNAFLQGWGASVIGNYQPPMEDMNSLFLLIFRQLAYIFEKGIPEYDPNINYFTGSIVQKSGIVYNSLTNSNIGNDPASDSGLNWSIGIGGNAGGVPTGAFMPWSGLITNVPTGYLLANGQAVSRTTYNRLFNVIGTTYGVGDGVTTFNLPDGRGRVLIGADGTSEFLNIGQLGGEKTHTLTEAELAPHKHPISSMEPFDLRGGGLLGTVTPSASGTGLTDNAGGGQPHNNLQPYLVIGGIIIKY